MKTTDHFKRTIQMYLEQRATEDALFAKNYRNPAKNIDDCVTYILNYVQKSGCNLISHFPCEKILKLTYSSVNS